MKTSPIFCLLLIYSTFCFAQNRVAFRKQLASELEGNKIVSNELIMDFNCDKKNDYAVVLQSKKDKENMSLYIVYTKKNGFTKQNAGAINDIMDLNLDYANKDRKLAGPNLKYSCNSVFVHSNDYEYLFGFNQQQSKFEKLYEHHIGP